MPYKDTDKAREYNTAYKKRPKARQQYKDWTALNHEHVKELRRAWRLRNLERSRAYGREWQKKYRATGLPQRHRRELERKRRFEIIQKLGGKCAQCGFSDYRALQIDHVNGGGRREMSVLTHYTSYYKKILERLPTGAYQILCSNCNWIKRYERHEYRFATVMVPEDDKVPIAPQI